MNKTMIFGLLILTCFSLAFAEEQKVTISIDDNVLIATHACERLINGTLESWDCDETIDYELTATWIDEDNIKLEITNLKIQEDYKIGNEETIENDILNKQIPIKIYNKESKTYNEKGWTFISELNTKHDYNTIVNKEEILGKEYHIGENSAVYLINTTTVYTINNSVTQIKIQNKTYPVLYSWNSTSEAWVQMGLIDITLTESMNTLAWKTPPEIIVDTTEKVTLRTDLIEHGGSDERQMNYTMYAGQPQVQIELMNTSEAWTAPTFYIRGSVLGNSDTRYLMNGEIESGHTTLVTIGSTDWFTLWNDALTNMTITVGSNVNMTNDIGTYTYDTGGNNGLAFAGAPIFPTPMKLYYMPLIGIDTVVGANGDVTAPNTLNNTVSATFWNVTQNPSFATSWFNASLREVSISRSYDDDNKQYTDTYTYTNVTSDFTTLDGTDGVPYFAYALVNATSITPSMNYFIPSELGYYPAILSASEISTTTYSISTMPDIIINEPLNQTYASIPILNFTLRGGAPHYNCTYNINDIEVSEVDIVNNTDYTNSSINWTIGVNKLNITCQEGFPYYHNQTNSTIYTIESDLELSISSPTNSTYNTNALNVTYLANSSASDNLNCTVFFSGVANDTYTDVNNTERTFDFTQGSEGTYNVTVNCYDGMANQSSVVYYTFSAELELSISSPTNVTYMDSDLTLTYLPNSSFALATNINCSVYFDGALNITNVDVNNTARNIGFRELNATFHNVSVNCGDGNENLTRSVYYTMDDINFTLTNSQNATAYEGVTNFYNVTIGINPDIISDVNASLYWNDTQIGYAFKGNRDILTYWFNQTFMLPIITTNNTSINTKWNITKLYTNASTYVENSSNTAQAGLHSWEWDATTYSVDLIERSINDISVNVSKFGGVNSPVNSTILATLVWNGSPSTMTTTMNTSTLLGYSNNTRMPRIPAGYNWTFGFNVTLNYSINHGILGYHSRTDTNSTYNYTQTVHITWIGNCTTTGVPFIQTLNFFMYDEETEGAVTENFQAERIDIILADGTSRNYTLPEMTGSTNYSICLYPSWSNYSGVYIAVKYAINSSSYDARRYFLINSTLDNVTNNIGLYNLNGVPITFTVLDETGSEVPNAYLDIRRFYASINNYRTIAMAKTGDSGTASTYLDVKLCTGSTETLYSIDIYDNRSILIKSLPDQSLSDTNCDGIASETLKITLGGAIYNYGVRSDALSYSNSTTNISNSINFTSNITDTLGIVNSITLNCYRIRNIGNLLISTETITASSASITCALGDVTGNNYIIQTIVTYPFFGDVTFTETLYSEATTYDFGGDGVLAAFFLLVALAIGYATTPALSLISLIIGLIIIYNLRLTLFNLDAIVTLIFSIIFIIYIIGRKK